MRSSPPIANRVLIFGSGPVARALISEMEASPIRGYSAAAILHDHLPESARIIQAVERLGLNRIVVARSDRKHRIPMATLLECKARGVVVEDALEFYERLTGKIAIEALRPGAVVFSRGFPTRGVADAFSRMISVLAAAIVLVLSAPFLALIALAIKLDSPGPVLFVQERSGKHGRPFNLFKFRTMRPSAERASEWEQDNKSRITRVGKWLRRFRIDEVPQLINILRGEMNLVGPRPHPTSNCRLFMDRIAYYRLRSMVLPGVTGWAQVRYGYANNLEEETEKMRYDLYYIKNRTLWLDIRILFETIGIVLLGGSKLSPKSKAASRAWASGARRAVTSPLAAQPLEPVVLSTQPALSAVEGPSVEQA
jgi:exopolysaccharide biosynthesis polyprenyl glycosylphosphotransferase